MADYKKMYFELFNKITDVIDELKAVQCKTEEIYMDTDFEEDEVTSEDDELFENSL